MVNNYMKTICLLLTIIFFFCQPAYCHALEWKRLHEEADKTDASDILGYLQNNPDSIDSLYKLGLVYLNLHKDTEAQEVFKKILNLQPSTPEAKWGLAELLRRKHDVGKSEDLINEVINSSPEFVPAYITLAYIKYSQFKFEDSLRLALKVIEKGRERVDLSNYTRAYLIVGANKGMIAHYGGPISKLINGTAVLSNLRKAQKLQPDSSAVMFGLGSFYLLAPGFAGGDLGKAAEFLKKAIELDPLFADSYVRLGQVYKVKGDEKKYKEYLNRALEIDSGNELANDIKNGKCKFICVGRPR
ncbi:MAG: tetratricopeptide repeat protein [Candidatus Omnitrophica bacterium]|nr:tetratricopeptide repeat protein [Candidatus Omnitrophota bacterium]